MLNSEMISIKKKERKKEIGQILPKFWPNSVGNYPVVLLNGINAKSG